MHSCVRSCLRYLYSDSFVAEAEQALELVRNERTNERRIVIHLCGTPQLSLADRLQLDDLKTNCTSLIQRRYDFTSLENILQLTDLAFTYNALSIVRMCVNALRAQFDWAEVKAAMPTTVSDQCNAQITRQFFTGANEIII